MTAKKTDGRGSGSHSPSPNRRLKPGLSSRRTHAFEAEIGKKMRAMYDDLMEQPLPDRFLELLSRIDQAQETQAKETQGQKTHGQENKRR